MKRFLITLFLAPAVLVSGQEAKSTRPYFRRVTKEPPFQERIDLTAVSHGENLYILGGYGILGWFDDVWASPDGENWKQVTKGAPWGGRSQHRTVSHDGRIFLVGGYNGKPLNDVWSSTDGTSWERLTEAAPWTPRHDFQLEVLDGRMYLFGGLGEWKRYNDVWSSVDGREWELVTAEAPWAPRSDAQSVVHNGQIIMMGGCYFDYESWKDKYMYGHYVYFEDVWATRNGKDWERLTERTLLGGRIHGAMVSLHDWIYFIGGDDDSQTPSPSRVTWASRDAINWNALKQPRREEQRNIRRAQLAHAVHKDHAYTIGGKFFLFYPDVLRLEGDTANPDKHFEAINPRPKLQPFHPLYGKQLYDN